MRNGKNENKSQQSKQDWLVGLRCVEVIFNLILRRDKNNRLNSKVEFSVYAKERKENEKVKV